MISIARFSITFQEDIQLKEARQFRDDHNVIKSWTGRRRRSNRYIFCFIFICNNKRTLSGSRRYFREPLIRFNFPAMSAYATIARTHSCVRPEFPHGGMALLGTVGKDIVAGGRKSGDPGYFSRAHLRFTFSTNTLAASYRCIYTS